MFSSSSSRAASFFSQFEYHSFWADVFPIILMVVLGISWAIYFRKKIRRQAAAAPKDAFRNDREKFLHRLSLFFIALPIFYSFFFAIDLFWSAFSMLGAQVLIMMVLRFLEIQFTFRLMALLPACLLSIAVGEVILVWPHIELFRLQTHAPLTLTLSGLSFSIGYFLSYISYPAAYRARAW
jgi:hypothetical protein